MGISVSDPTSTSASRQVLTEVRVGIVPTDGSVGNAAVGSEPTLGSVGNWNCNMQDTHMSHTMPAVVAVQRSAVCVIYGRPMHRQSARAAAGTSICH